MPQLAGSIPIAGTSKIVPQPQLAGTQLQRKMNSNKIVPTIPFECIDDFHYEKMIFKDK